MSITRNMLEGSSGETLKPGDYLIEISGCKHKEGISEKNGKKWEKMVLFSEIAEPEADAGKKFTTSLWYDKKVADMVVSVGKTLDDLFGKDETIDQEKLFAMLQGQFIKVRVGLKNGYNEIAEILKTDEKKKLEESV